MDSTPSSAGPEPADAPAASEERLHAEYAALRSEDDAWQGRAISLGSFFMVVVSTTAFFLLKGQPHKYADLVYLAAPVPSFCITALIARQAVTATIRGRWLLAMERALAPRSGTFKLASGREVPVVFAHHAQQLWLDGLRGVVVTALEYVPLSLLIGLCVLARQEIQDGCTANVAATIYLTLLVALLVVSAPTGIQRLRRKRQDGVIEGEGERLADLLSRSDG